MLEVQRNDGQSDSRDWNVVLYHYYAYSLMGLLKPSIPVLIYLD